MTAAYITWGIAAWIIIGILFAHFMAIGTRAVITLIVAWPIFAVLIIAAPIINWYLNNNRKDQ